jgi:starvation-inducible DNA-binding protein
MTTNIGITAIHRQEIVNHLGKLLADEYVLYTKTRNAHWNIEGDDFYDKHLFFQTQFQELDAIIDEVAERIRTLGHYATASLKVFLSATHLSESNVSKNNSPNYIKELLSDHESIIISIREILEPITKEYKDLGTNDFLIGAMEQHEKMAWILRSHLP